MGWVLGIIKCFLLAYKTEWMSALCSINEGEALGLLAAINWVIELHLVNVSFELVSKLVVDSLNYPNEDASNFGAIV